MNASSDPMRLYRAKKDSERRTVFDSYNILGFLASGTYGRVYKAQIRSGADANTTVAIKKFKPDKEGELPTYTGISQSACREIMLNRELNHVNLTALREVLLEDKSIYMVFEYAEHDLLQIIHHHTTARNFASVPVLKSMLWQLINGVTYLHDNWVIHRDLKPANILVTDRGVVKIGDLGLARIYASPLQSLFTSDKVVVTIWYRSPDLLLGAKHYTASVDLWSIGCIFGELIALRPMFKGEEAKMETQTVANTANKKGTLPFQKDQLTRVFEILGLPTKQRWPSITQLPEYARLKGFTAHPNDLWKWYSQKTGRGASQHGFALLSALLTYDPALRITARDALTHPWWNEEPKVARDTFPPDFYPMRRVSHDDSEKIDAASQKPTSNASSLQPNARLNKRPRLD